MKDRQLPMLQVSPFPDKKKCKILYNYTLLLSKELDGWGWTQCQTVSVRDNRSWFYHPPRIDCEKNYIHISKYMCVNVCVCARARACTCLSTCPLELMWLKVNFSSGIQSFLFPRQVPIPRLKNPVSPTTFP